MKKKNFTLIELLVVITIIAILAAMLFPTFGKMQRKAQQNNSKNNAKSIMTGVASYFSDVRKKNMPSVADTHTVGAEATTIPEIAKTNLFTCPAGGGIEGDAILDYDYVQGAAGGVAVSGVTGTFLINNENEYDPDDTTTGWAAFRGSGAAGARVAGQAGKWASCNSDDSPLITTGTAFLKTVSLTPVAFGDGHVEISGDE